MRVGCLWMLCLGLGLGSVAQAGTWVEGVPVIVQKSDTGTLHLLYIQMATPVTTDAPCSSKAGVVIHDNNPSATAAQNYAMAALASGNKFRCYINTNQCSAITGAATTFPVCEYYPGLKKA